MAYMQQFPLFRPLTPIFQHGGFNPLVAPPGFNPFVAPFGFNPLASPGLYPVAPFGFNPLASIVNIHEPILYKQYITGHEMMVCGKKTVAIYDCQQSKEIFYYRSEERISVCILNNNLYIDVQNEAKDNYQLSLSDIRTTFWEKKIRSEGVFYLLTFK